MSMQNLTQEDCTKCVIVEDVTRVVVPVNLSLFPLSGAFITLRGLVEFQPHMTTRQCKLTIIFIEHKKIIYINDHSYECL